MIKNATLLRNGDMFLILHAILKEKENCYPEGLIKGNLYRVLCYKFINEGWVCACPPFIAGHNV